MEEQLLLIYILGAVISAGIGSVIGKTKSREGAGAFLGLILGPIGWLLILFGPDNGEKCPKCKGSIEQGAEKCKHFGSDLNKW